MTTFCSLTIFNYLIFFENTQCLIQFTQNLFKTINFRIELYDKVNVLTTKLELDI